MATISQIKKIHILKNLIGLDDYCYQDMLMSFGVVTSKNLTYTEAIIFIEILEDKAVESGLWEKLPKNMKDYFEIMRWQVIRSFV